MCFVVWVPPRVGIDFDIDGSEHLVDHGVDDTAHDTFEGFASEAKPGRFVEVFDARNRPELNPTLLTPLNRVHLSR